MSRSNRKQNNMSSIDFPSDEIDAMNAFMKCGHIEAAQCILCRHIHPNQSTFKYQLLFDTPELLHYKLALRLLLVSDSKLP